MNTRMAGDSRQIRAEAASWVARLHGPDRDEDMEAVVQALARRKPGARQGVRACDRSLAGDCGSAGKLLHASEQFAPNR